MQIYLFALFPITPSDISVNIVIFSPKVPHEYFWQIRSGKKKIIELRESFTMCQFNYVRVSLHLFSQAKSYLVVLLAIVVMGKQTNYRELTGGRFLITDPLMYANCPSAHSDPVVSEI